jgi:transposase
MKEKLRFLGLDVHAETLGPVEKLRACYEAGPTSYVLYWQLAEPGVKCEVIAPSLVPVKAGDRARRIGVMPRSWRAVTDLAI